MNKKFKKALKQSKTIGKKNNKKMAIKRWCQFMREALK